MKLNERISHLCHDRFAAQCERKARKNMISDPCHYPEAAKAENIECPRCGRSLRPNMFSCPNCGNLITRVSNQISERSAKNEGRSVFALRASMIAGTIEMAEPMQKKQSFLSDEQMLALAAQISPAA